MLLECILGLNVLASCYFMWIIHDKNMVTITIFYSFLCKERGEMARRSVGP